MQNVQAESALILVQVYKQYRGAGEGAQVGHIQYACLCFQKLKRGSFPNIKSHQFIAQKEKMRKIIHQFCSPKYYVLYETRFYVRVILIPSWKSFDHTYLTGMPDSKIAAFIKAAVEYVAQTKRSGSLTSRLLCHG